MINFMEQLIQISKLNDFLYSPKSLYFHSVYEGFNSETYHDTPQTIGRANHLAIDAKKYSSSKKYLQGITVYSEIFGLIGKIDIFNKQTKTLIERKTKIKTIHPGYKMQLFAQYYCMLEMGYEVQNLALHSLEDNKRYKIEIPNEKDLANLENLIHSINEYDVEEDSKFWHFETKDNNTIYQELYF